MNPGEKIKVVIVDSFQGNVEGYVRRLNQSQKIEVVATANFSINLELVMEKFPADILLLDFRVPISIENRSENRRSHPILQIISRLLQLYPHLNILVTSMFSERGLVRGVMAAGVKGYILKDDTSALIDIANVVLTVASGGIYVSQKMRQGFLSNGTSVTGRILATHSLETRSR